MFPFVYPFYGFDQGNVDEVATLLDRAPPGAFRMRIQYMIEENKTIKVVCLDEYTKNRLCEVVSSFVFRLPAMQQLIPIKVLLKDKMPKFVTFSCILNDYITEQGFLSRVFRQNDVDTRRSSINYKGYTRDGYKIIFKADPVCACEIFKKHFKLSVREERVYFKVVDNPYANLFRRRIRNVR